MKRIAILSLCLLAAACAKKPESIQAAYVSPTQFNNHSCDQLSAEQANLEDAYSRASAQQNQARRNDIAGVILIGLPVSSLSGDNIASQIAYLKGQKDAVRSTMIRKNCPGISPAS